MRRLWRWALPVSAVAIAALRPFRVEVAGRSMEPTLRAGDWLVATRLGRRSRGRVVVVADPRSGLALVKRIAACAGDVVDGRTLRPHEYAVVGDNAGASTDGRTFGPVDAGAIEGVVRLRYAPRVTVVRSGARHGRRRGGTRVSASESPSTTS